MAGDVVAVAVVLYSQGVNQPEQPSCGADETTHATYANRFGFVTLSTYTCCLSADVAEREARGESMARTLTLRARQRVQPVFDFV